MGNSRNTIIGFMLLFGLVMAWSYFSQPSKEEMDAYKEAVQEYQDSIAVADSLAQLQAEEELQLNDSLTAIRDSIVADSTIADEVRDSLLQAIEAQAQPATESSGDKFGAFAESANCPGETFTVENDKLLITFSTKGGRIVDVKLKDYLGYDLTTEDKYDKIPVHLLNNAKDIFRYSIPVAGTKGGTVSSEELCFTYEEKGKSVVFRAYAANKNEYIEQSYIIPESGYLIDYNLKFEGLDEYMGDNKNVSFTWKTHLNKIEKNPSYERRMSSIHYRETEKSPSYCTCASDAEAELEKSVQWISHAQQFFNSSLIVEGDLRPENAKLQTKMMDDTASHLKELTTRMSFPINSASTSYDMQMYIGPNEHNTLAGLGIGLEKVIPFGWSIFGVISRYVIRPIFNFFAGFIPSYGLIIILLTLLIRAMMFPLQYRMLKSSVKMGILRPKLEAMRKKLKDDKQAMQMQQMKMYQEYGVSPLGGCLPMLLTMPIWIALYRFFPASIEFRQKGFLWADDLVSYDSIWDFGHVPFIYDIYGDHVSLFTLLWCISMFAYLVYNSSQMNMNAAGGGQNMQMMKYMQYAFPVIFFFALNSWAAGLTCYMLFSNLFNIGQTYLVKNVLIDKEKLKAEMEKKKEKPKKKGRWQKMLEEAQKKQKEQMEQRKKGKK